MSRQAANKPVDRLFEHYNRPGSPGCALGVMQGGKLVYKKGYGLANLEYNIPITPATLFPVASMAKQFTAMAVALLANEGALSLDDDIRTHLPEVPDFGTPITIRHLIHHTSGLRGDLMLLLSSGWRLEDAITNEDVIALVKRQRELNFPPGEQFSYCGTGYLLLALIVEQVSSTSFSAFCQERIFEPLGMAHTLFQDETLQVIKDRAYAYYPADSSGYQNAILTCSLVGGTGLFTSIDDLALWDENLSTGRVGGPAVIEQMQQRGVLNSGRQIDYAFGLIADTYQGLKVIYHGGDGAGIHSFMMRFPGEDFCVAILGNCSTVNARGLAAQVADLFLANQYVVEAVKTNVPETIELASEQLVPWTGRYFDPGSSTFVDVEHKDGRLRVWGYELLPVSETSFIFAASPDATANFSPARESEPIQVQIDLGRGPTNYTRFETAAPSADDLAAYCGRYYSPELDVHWTVALAGDHLSIHRRKQGSSSLAPMIPDVFTDAWIGQILHSPGKPWILAFDRDENRTVSGFRVSDAGGTLRNLKFFRQETKSRQAF